MKKRSKTYIFLKAIAVAICLPVVILWILIVALYIPPVQRFAVEKISHMAGEASGFDIETGSFHLAFPLKLSIAGFRVSRNDTTFLQGKNADVNISLQPLFKGEVEVNYVSLENTRVNTANLIEGMNINGEIGFFRAVARNVDLVKETVNLRQVHLHSTDISLTLNDTTESEDDEDKPEWAIDLHRGNIENCNLNISLPLDTISATAYIGKLHVRDGSFNIGEEAYTIKRAALSNSKASFDAGRGDRLDEPLKHLIFENINIGCKNIAYTQTCSNVEIEHLTLIQPGGARITDATAILSADRKELEIEKLSLKSRNGSSIHMTGNVPWFALMGSHNEEMTASASLALNKKDLKALLTEKEYNALNIFDENMFKAEAVLNGNSARMNVNTLYVQLPTLAELHADGYAKNISDIKKIEASLDIYDTTGDLHKFIAHGENDSIGDSNIGINGNIAYKCGKANAAINIKGVGGNIDVSGMYDINDSTYSADIEVAGIDIAKMLPDIPLNSLTAGLKGKGRGFDIFDSTTCYQASLRIDTLLYDRTLLNSISLTASQDRNISDIMIGSDSRDLKFNVKANTELRRNDISNKTDIEIEKADFMLLGLTDADLGTGMKLSVEASTDMHESHALKLNGKKIRIITEKKTFTPADISVDFSTTPGLSYIHAGNGDLQVDGKVISGYNGLKESFGKISEMFNRAFMEEDVLYYLHDYEKALPEISFDFKCGQDNMLHNYLALNGINVDDMSLNINLDSIKGINMNGGVYGFKNGELNLDTIRLFTRQDGNVVRYLAGVRSTTLNPNLEKMTFNAMLYGNIFNDSVTTSFMFRDSKERVGMKLGIKTLVKPKELDIRFRPDAVLFGSKFRFNDDNFIRIGKGYSVNADVTLMDNDDAGMHFNTAPDKESQLNANLELFNVNLKKLTGMLPFAPDIGGMLNLELYCKSGEDDLLLSSDVRIDSLSYDGTHIGNESLEIVYFPKEEKMHYLDIILSHNGEEAAHLDGDYLNESDDPGLHGNITLTRFPLDITRAFMKDAGMSLCGYVNSEMNADGKLSGLDTNGYIQFDSVYVNAPLFGTDLHLAEKRVNIENNRILFNGFDIFAKGDSPFKLNGSVDMSRLTDPTFNLRMNASDYELINAPRTKESMLYGRMFIDFRAFISGTLNSMKVYGNAALLGKSNITYVMQDAPISTDKELDGLVEFVDFADTTKVKEVEKEADFGNTNISLGLRIEDGARINADFDTNRNSYVALRGGGNLNMTYTSENGMNVTGTYEMNDGELKYELPIIPLKTFSIVDGSKVTWNGDILDPTIEITALERVTTSVSMDDGGSQPVAFDVGVRLSNTLSNMGLTFTISAPENAMVQDQLNSLDAETLNKYAVTMLITGTYIGNSKGMSVTDALNSFLDAQINNIAGNAMKSVSVNVGINDAENAETGGTYKNYSFSFKKRFWNDRLTIVIGGEVNSGDRPAANDSFINNVSLEWRIGDSGNRYLRLFYDKNYESLLEGEIIETGIGYVYKRKLQNLRELFIFKRERDSKQK